jgi:hypothetical protein
MNIPIYMDDNGREGLCVLIVIALQSFWGWKCIHCTEGFQVAFTVSRRCSQAWAANLYVLLPIQRVGNRYQIKYIY